MTTPLRHELLVEYRLKDGRWFSRSDLKHESDEQLEEDARALGETPETHVYSPSGRRRVSYREPAPSRRNA